MKVYLDKLPDGHPMRGRFKLKNDNTINYLVPPVVVGYEPPPLQKLGKRLLGLEEWSVQKNPRKLDV